MLSRAANQDKLLIPRMELEIEVQLLSTSIINKLGLPSAAGHLSLSRWHVSLAFRFRTEVKPKLLKFATTLSYHLLVALLEHEPLNHTASYKSKMQMQMQCLWMVKQLITNFHPNFGQCFAGCWFPPGKLSWYLRLVASGPAPCLALDHIWWRKVSGENEM